MAKRYPRTVIDLPTSKEMLEWIKEIEDKGNKRAAKEIWDLWQKKYKEWQQGKWGYKSWTDDEADRRAAAFARGKYHYLKGDKKSRKLSKNLKTDYGDDFDKFKKLGTAKEKRDFIKGIDDDRQRAKFSSYRRAGLVRGRSMDLMKTEDVGKARMNLEIAISPRLIKARKDETVEFTVVIMGGVPPYRGVLAFGDGKNEKFRTSQKKSYISHTYKKIGKFNTHLIVEDSE